MSMPTNDYDEQLGNKFDLTKILMDGLRSFWKYLCLFAGIFILVIIALNLWAWQIDTKGHELENNIGRKMVLCADVEDENVAVILDLVKVRDSNHAFLASVLIGKTAPTNASETALQGSYQDMMYKSGDPTKFILALSAISGTDLSAMDKELSNAIKSLHAQVLACETPIFGVNGYMDQYTQLIGVDVNGNLVVEPKATMARNAKLPTEYKDGNALAPTKDWNGDGKITVLDWHIPVSLKTMNKWTSGSDGEVPTGVLP